MARTRKQLVKRLFAYAGFFSFALTLSLYITFPYELVKQRVVNEAKNAGFHVTMKSLGPGLLGITASGVKLSKSVDALPPLADGQERPAPEPLEIDSVSVRPALFPPGVAVRAKLLGGTASVGVGALGAVSVRAGLDGLDLSKGNMKGFSGMDLVGQLNGELSLSIPNELNPATKKKEPDLSAANGKFSLQMAGLAVNGGTITVPLYGQPTPVDLPKITVGDIDAALKFEKGLGTVETFTGKGPDLELLATGTLKLSKKVEYSEPALELKLKAEPEFVKRLGMLGAGLSMLQADPQNPSFRVAKISGYLNRPNFGPGR